MDIQQPLALLGGLTPAQFMRRHWQKKPLLVRQAIPQFAPPVLRTELFALAAQEGVESRLVQLVKGAWKLRHGPFSRRALPALQQPDWTLLVQGVDLHNAAVHALTAKNGPALPAIAREFPGVVSDGVLDRHDDCPDQFEDADGYLDEDGCPEPDNDNDGVLDEADECPELPAQPGDVDGCPSKTYVTVQDGQLVIFGKVQFQFGSSKLEPKSEPLLDQIAVVLKGHAELGSVRVEGHTDAVGADVDNLSLSDRRAQSVAEILTRDFQIPPENLTTQGYGEQYLKVNTQEASRENRRVTLRRITPLLNGQNQ